MRDRRLAFCAGGVCWPSSQTSNRLVSDRKAPRQLGHATATCGKVRSSVALAEVSLLLGILLGVPSAAAQQEDQGKGPPHSARGCAHATPGPIYDPISGDRVGRDDLSCLPSGRHLGAVFDVWFNRVLNQQIAGGGIAFFDPLRLSSHGRSWRQTRFHLNGIEITDPARPGEPLFELPYGAWDGLAYRSLWTSRPGADLTFHADIPTTWQLTGATGQDVGGGTWIPRGLLDREPATAYGATSERRRLRANADLFVERAWKFGEKGRLRLVGSFVDHERRYPTLRSADGQNIVDRAQRGTFALRHQYDDGRTRLDTTLFGQTSGRSHEGAQYRWEHPFSLDTASRAWGVHFKWTRPKANVAFFVGVAARHDDERTRFDTPFVRDLESEWVYLSRPRDAEDLQRWRLDLGAEWVWKGWHLQMRGAHTRIGLDAHTQTLEGISYLRGPDRGLPAAHALELSAPGVRHELRGREGRVDVKRDFRVGNVTVQVVTAVDHSAGGARHTPGLGHWSPALGAAMRTPCGGSECFALIRHEPLALTRDVSEFLSPAGESTTHVWNDDGDLVPEPGEAGRLLARHGGVYHAVSEDLVRPSQNHLAFGIRTARFGAFRAVVTGVGRWVSQRYTVQLSDPSLYSPVEVRTAGGQLVTAYEKDLSRAGQETYVLTNDPDRSRYLGVEIQVHTEAVPDWFLNLSATGYQVMSNAPFGSFADRNDPGAISEISADPNARLNTRGRADNDRAYGVTLLLGRRLARDLWLSTATRYLDGQPFARIDVVEPLPQGPTAIMTTQRGTPGPRHTFHMTTDVRLAYLWRGNDHNKLSLALDVFNLLGSGTEIVEDPRAGVTYRRALEMVPGRSLLLTVGWQGPFH